MKHIEDKSSASRRLSVRRVAIMHGMPARVVARAVASGELPAIIVRTETGRHRSYILPEDALNWLESLHSEASRAQ